MRKANTSCGNGDRGGGAGGCERETRERGGRERETRENFQARRRNYIGSEWNISSGALHPTKTRKTEGWEGCATSPAAASILSFSTHTRPSYGLLTGNLPRLLLTVLSLYSLALRRSDGRPSFLFLATFLPIPPSFARIQAVSSSGFPSRSSPPIDLSPFPLSWSRRFILRAVRSSLRWHELREVSVTRNPFVCRTPFVVSPRERTFSPSRLDRKTEIEIGKGVTDEAEKSAVIPGDDN